MNEIEIEQTLKRAKEIVAHYMPSWEGGFACNVINSIEELQRQNKILSTRLHNERCLDDELIFCTCSKKHRMHERIRGCDDCGGAVEGILIKQTENHGG